MKTKNVYTLEIKIKGPMIFAYPLKKGLDLELIRMRRLNDWSRVIPVGNRNWSDCYAAAEGCGEPHQGRLWIPPPLPLRVKLFHVQVKSPLIISVENSVLLVKKTLKTWLSNEMSNFFRVDSL